MAEDPAPDLDALRQAIRSRTSSDETSLMSELLATSLPDPMARRQVSAAAAGLVRELRAQGHRSLMEDFLGEYGLSTTEGVGLMCLAEALLRVPDDATIDDLIRDKIEPSNWGAHLGRSSSPLVNASTWALMLTGRLLDDGVTPGTARALGPLGALRGLVRQAGEPVVRVAVAQAMKTLGQQFVLGQTIDDALRRGRPKVAEGYTYSYDMLGEAARTAADASRYLRSYTHALTALRTECGADIRMNPGISVKLSALHPRFEYSQRERVLAELVPRVLQLARLASDGNMGFNIDAEEADRLDLSLDVIQAVLSHPDLRGWDGFGIVVQAYGKRAWPVIDWLYALAERLDRRIMVRLVKGAYWDSEIKLAQALGLSSFPVFTRKIHTDVNYLACARRLLARTDRIYPQFATHNAHTCAAVMAMGGDRNRFEFQRLHGMGEALHRIVMARSGTRCRIYAPVGAHRDLLAYLVRRLLENGANSSFVNQIADERVPPEVIARDPFDQLAAAPVAPDPSIVAPPALYQPIRPNSRGWNVEDPEDIAAIDALREPFRRHQWRVGPEDSTALRVLDPADLTDTVGWVTPASDAQVSAALDAAAEGFREWSRVPVARRAGCLRHAAELFEAHAGELWALCTREAGKTLADAVAELREAVDFLNYYAAEAERIGAAESIEAQARVEAPLPGKDNDATGRGIFVCISPWNFPLAIFTGQVAAALAAGNAVIAKPAEQTTLIAARAVQLLHEAGIPAKALQMVPGSGEVVGAALTASGAIAGVLFTGSTEAARAINRSLAEHGPPDAVLVAETGGLNAMIVDSTALPEQTVRDIIASAFRSAGQRCSALRILYVQKDVSRRVLDMLSGAMDELALGDPWSPSTDVGPLIDAEARREIQAYCDRMTAAGALVKQLPAPKDGRFVAPHVFKVRGIQEVEREVFGPVLHVATFDAQELDQVVRDINDRGYGLTFGLHTRIDQRVARVVEKIRAGNIYVNRNQIGAVVGSQPFGGEGLSGTGPKAGGPHYLARLIRRGPRSPAGSFSTHESVVGAPGAAPGAPDVEVAEGLEGGRPAPAGGEALPSAQIATTVEESLRRLTRLVDQPAVVAWSARSDRLQVLRQAFEGLLPSLDEILEAASPLAGPPRTMPGPTGERNELRLVPRGVALCLGPGREAVLAQAVQALATGGGALLVTRAASRPVPREALQACKEQGVPVDIVEVATMPGDPEWLTRVENFGVVAYAGPGAQTRAIRKALARRNGEIKPLVTEVIAPERYLLERLVCVDTTAAGGNASLLAGSAGAGGPAAGAGGPGL